MNALTRARRLAEEKLQHPNSAQPGDEFRPDFFFSLTLGFPALSHARCRGMHEISDETQPRYRIASSNAVNAAEGCRLLG